MKFLTHDAICNGVFNRDHCAATGSMAGWEEPLSNNVQLLNVALDRMESDFSGLHAKMRKPYGTKEVDALIQTKLKCRCFGVKLVHLLRELAL